MSRNSKRDVFLIFDGGQKLDTEADIFEALAADEAYLLKQYPLIKDHIWRVNVLLGSGMEKEHIATQILDRLHILRDALKDPDTPAWKAAALGMAYQTIVNIYEQPVMQTAVGRVNAKKRVPQQPKDALTMCVLRHLRSQGKTWKETLRALEFAASNHRMIAHVEIEHDCDCFFFSDNEKSHQVEAFKVSTLQCKKFPKARKDPTP